MYERTRADDTRRCADAVPLARQCEPPAARLTARHNLQSIWQATILAALGWRAGCGA